MPRSWKTGPPQSGHRGWCENGSVSSVRSFVDLPAFDSILGSLQASGAGETLVRSLCTGVHVSPLEPESQCRLVRIAFERREIERFFIDTVPLSRIRLLQLIRFERLAALKA